MKIKWIARFALIKIIAVAHPPFDIYPQLQKLLFSATLSQNPEKLQQLNLFQPKLFTSVVKQVEDTKSDSKDESSAAENKTEASSGGGEFVGKYTTPGGLTVSSCTQLNVTTNEFS